MTPDGIVTLTSEAFEDTSLLSFPLLREVEGFVHAVTTRPWNLAAHRGPHVELAIERRKRLCAHLGLPFERLTVPEQIHSAHVVRVRPSDVGAGREGRQTAMRFVDGLVCDLPRTGLMLFSADCPIIVAVEPRRRVFGAVHASWRGTVARIAEELVRQLRRAFHVEPGDLRVGIGPCAGPTEYEVGEEVFRIAEAQLPGAQRFFPTVGGRRFFDLRGANATQLAGTGVQPERIGVATECTISDQRFYSHRRDGPDTGRFAFIAGFR